MPFFCLKLFSSPHFLQDDANKKLYKGFPGGAVVENLPANAGDTGSIPGWGTKIPHATGQLSPCAATKELVRHNYGDCAL